MISLPKEAKMAAYFVALGRIDDQERFSKYLEGVVPTLEAYGGRLLALEDPAEVLEGDASLPRVVLLEFPNKEAIRAWQGSREYQAIAEHRRASSEHVFYAVDEFVPPR